jgi:flavin-binding protein dodecin
MSVELRMSFVETDGRIGSTVVTIVGKAATELESAAAQGVSRQASETLRQINQFLRMAQRSSFTTLSAGRRENETTQQQNEQTKK